MIIVDELRSSSHALRHKFRRKFLWCSMFSDQNISELTDMADRVGSTADWFCEGRTSLLSYYILNEDQRSKAIQNGAVVMRSHEVRGFIDRPEILNSKRLRDKHYNHVDVDREYSAHKPFFRPEFADNLHILKWWQPEHDAMIRERIAEKQWLWHYDVHTDILKLTPQDVIEAWRSSDPVPKVYAWYNVLRCFAAARADQLGLTSLLQPAKRNICILCQSVFSEDSVTLTHIKMLGVEHINVCNPCMQKSLCPDPEGKVGVDKEYVIGYLQELSQALQRVPVADYGWRRGFNLVGIGVEQRVLVLKALCRRPRPGSVEALCGSWLSALIMADVLEDGTRRTSRGTHCLAKDGHVCLSLGEKTVDDFLYEHGIAHDKEPPYPEGRYRADFAVEGTLIEYLGLAGNAEYDAKTRIKMQICKSHGINLILLYPLDLTGDGLAAKVLANCIPTGSIANATYGEDNEVSL